MDIKGLGPLLLPKGISGVPLGPDVIFIPLEKTAVGWKIQLNGRILLAQTEGDFIPGVPVRASVFRGANRLELRLEPSLPAAAQSPLVLKMISLGRPVNQPQAEKLQRWLTKTPGQTDAEKSRWLLELDERNLLSSSFLNALELLLGSGAGDQSGNRENPRNGQPDSSSEDGKQEEPVQATDAMAALDLWNASGTPGGCRWMLVPFTWSGPEEPLRGLARFFLDVSTGKVFKWSFSLSGARQGFLVEEGPVRKIHVFLPGTGASWEPTAKRLAERLKDAEFYFHSYSDYDGFDGTGSPGLKEVDIRA